MSNFMTFLDDIFSLISGFLMSEPIIYFVGVLLLLAVFRVFRSMLRF